MERLHGVDASFFYMETPNAHMHVMALAILEPASMADGSAFERIRRMFETRLDRIPPFRRRIRMVPFALDHPVWEDDPDFDLAFHLHHVALPPPATLGQLATVIGDIASRPLDRSIPLWEAWVIEGLPQGRVALVTKVHHATMDGVSGAAVLSQLLETSPDAPDPVPRPWTPRPPVRDLELLGRGLWSASSRIGIGDLPSALRGAGTSLASATRFVLSRLWSGGPGPALPFQTPVLPFNRAISPRRSVAFGRVSLDDVKHVRRAFGATVNDVVLTACSLALRDYLQERGELPDIPLVAAVPVAVGGPGPRETIGNRVSSMFVRLPVQLADPMAQLQAIRVDTGLAKSLHGALGATAFMRLTQVAPPLLFAGAMQLYSSLHLADRHRPAVNLVVSNIPGPPFPLYAAGARVESIHPMGPILEGIGLNLSVLSNAGHVDLGAIACRDTVPDVERITTCFVEAVDRLVALTKSPVERTESRAH